MEPQIRYCTSADGTSIGYATMGSGHPLVIIAGWGGMLVLTGGSTLAFARFMAPNVLEVEDPD